MIRLSKDSQNILVKATFKGDLSWSLEGPLYLQKIQQKKNTSYYTLLRPLEKGIKWLQTMAWQKIKLSTIWELYIFLLFWQNFIHFLVFVVLFSKTIYVSDYLQQSDMTYSFFCAVSIHTSTPPTKAGEIMQQASMLEVLQLRYGYVTSRNTSLSAVSFVSG